MPFEVGTTFHKRFSCVLTLSVTRVASLTCEREEVWKPMLSVRGRRIQQGLEGRVVRRRERTVFVRQDVPEVVALGRRAGLDVLNRRWGGFSRGTGHGESEGEDREEGEVHGAGR